MAPVQKVLPHHAGHLQRTLLGGVQQVHPGGQDRLHRVRDVQFAPVLELGGLGPAGPLGPASSLVREPADDLLQEERVAAGPFEDPRAQGRRRRLREQEVEEPPGLLRSTAARVSGPTCSRDRRPIPAAGGPGRGRLVPTTTSGPSTRGTTSWSTSRSAGSAQWRSSTTTRVGWAPAIAENSSACHAPAISCSPRTRSAGSGWPSGARRPTVRHSVATVRSRSTSAPARTAPTERRILPVGLLRVVAGQDPGLLLEDLPQGPVGDALTVGEAPPAQDDRRLRQDGQARGELLGEPALAQAGVPVDRDQVGALLGDRPLVDAGQEGQLPVASDHRAPTPGVVAPSPDQLERPDRLAFPLTSSGPRSIRSNPRVARAARSETRMLPGAPPARAGRRRSPRRR